MDSHKIWTEKRGAAHTNYWPIPNIALGIGDGVKFTTALNLFNDPGIMENRTENFRMTPEETDQLARLIRERREEIHLSASEVARRAGVTPGTVTRIELGQIASPRPENLTAIGTVLGIPAADLFALTDWLPKGQLPTFGRRTYARNTANCRTAQWGKSRNLLIVSESAMGTTARSTEKTNSRNYLFRKEGSMQISPPRNQESPQSPSVLAVLRALHPDRPLTVLRGAPGGRITGDDDAAASWSRQPARPVPTEMIAAQPRIVVEYDNAMPGITSGASDWDTQRRSWDHHAEPR